MTAFTPSVLVGEAPDTVPPRSCVDWNETQILLYQRIMEFDIDGGPAEFTFTQRLARENGWTMAYTGRVIHEYKHFVFLMVNADHPVTPSDQVDQAWHLHLTYTQSYWDRLCHEIVGRPLHHTPTRGGTEEARKFDAWYGRTLISYQRWLDAPPPIDIWPDAATRFSDAFFFQRVNTQRHWVVGKPPSIVWFVAFAMGLSGFLYGAAAVINPDFFLLCLFIVAITIVIVGVEVKERYCAMCRRFNAVEKTGVVEMRNINEKWVEYRCKYCDRRGWKKRSVGYGANSGIGSGGDGGGDGCGGCGG